MKVLRYIGCIVALCMALPLAAQSYDTLWKQLERYQSENLPRSVIATADKIVSKAEADGDMGWLMKGMLVRAQHVREITPDSLPYEIARIESVRMAVTDMADKAVCASVLSQLWLTNSKYYPQARVAALEALASKEDIAAISALRYAPLVIEGRDGTYYNHSLYKAIADRSIDCLKRCDASPSASIDSLYNELISLCQSDSRMAEGGLLSTLDRLKYQRNTRRDISSSAATEQYTVALDSLISACADLQTCTEALYLRAEAYRSGGNNSAAIALCNEGLKRYSKYGRVNILSELRRSITAPSLSLYNESLYYPGNQCALRIEYKNVESAKITVESDKRRIYSRNVRLRSSDNYLQQDTTIFVPLNKPGKYSITLSAANAKSCSTTASVSRLRVLSLPLPDNMMEFVVVDGQSGKPVEGATLKIFNQKSVVTKSLITDSEGKAIVTWSNYRSVKAEVTGDTVQPATYIYNMSYGSSNTKTTNEVRLLTDRSIYRPGQKVMVKGVAYSRGNESAQVISGKSYTLQLLDANRQKVAEQELTTNDFGSFSATFTLPTSCLNGTFTLRTDGGSTAIKVEEYKRPTFDVTIESPKGSYRTGDTIVINGSAQMLNGVTFGGAQMEYSVKREERHWWRSYSNGYTTIDSGTGTTDADGRFTIATLLKPERPDDGRNYCYTIEATVTSAAGESQSASHRIYAGTSSLLLDIKADELICREESAPIVLKAVNMSGEAIDAIGSYDLYRIENDTILQAHVEGISMNGEINIADMWSAIRSGRYLLRISAKDEKGRKASAEATFTLFSESDKRPPVPTKEWFRKGNMLFDADHPATFSYGTSEKEAYVMVRLLSRDKLIESRLLTLSDTIIRYEIPYREEYGDGVNMLLSFVKDGEIYRRTVKMTRRLPERELKMCWSTFRDRLTPGNVERWTLTIKRPDGTSADAELAAMMYDASLDRLWSRSQSLSVGFNLYVPCGSWRLATYNRDAMYLNFPVQQIRYRALEFDRFYNNVSVVDSKSFMSGRATYRLAAFNASSKLESFDAMTTGETAEMELEDGGEVIDSDENVRTNLAETAFFYPQLHTDGDGAVAFEFTAPESLTEWRFNGYAHTRDMEYGALTALAKTQKELMVVPNMPRFVRIGDCTKIAVSIVNLGEKAVEGTALLTLFDPYTEKIIKKISSHFAAEAGATTTASFEFTVAADKEILGCRIVADGGNFSDGEQRLLPVLSDKMHLFETMAISAEGGAKINRPTDNLFNGQSKSATGRKITVEISANAAWSAVQALPTLTEPQSDDAFSWATAYYANAISHHIVKTNPQIKATVEAWCNDASAADKLRSPLQNNEELKGVLLSETPWVLDAQSETEQRERIVELLNDNNTLNNLATAQQKLKSLQLTDGSWPWFKGMSGSSTVTAYIAELNARLALFKGEELSGEMEQMQRAAIDYLHSEMQRRYQKLTAKERASYSLSYSDLRYLYIIAISGAKVEQSYTTSYQFYLSKVDATLQSNDMQTLSIAAVIEQRAGRASAARKFINAMREHLSADNDGALSFAFNERTGSFDCRQLPTHVRAMEAFGRVSSDTATVEKMKLWLLQRKRNQSWSSNVTTADAVYGLTMRGGDLLSAPANVSATIGGHTVSTTTYTKESFSDSSATKAKSISLKNNGGSMAWISIFAECDDDIDKVKSVSEAAITVKRELVGSPLRTGSKIVVRTTITIPSRMDFVMLKIDHAACMEPTATLSGYRWNGKIGYYQETKDASTCLYFDSIGKGEYIFESEYRLSRSGEYQSGISTVKSLYSPEYSAHSDSKRIIIAD